MRFLFALTLTVLSAAFAAAQTIPVTFADLAPAAQERLVKAWKENYKSEISALPPGQEPVKPVAGAKPATTVAAKAKGVIPYADLVEKVKAGAIVTVVIVRDGSTPTPPPGGFVCQDAPPGVLTAGTWAAWQDADGERFMRRLDSPVAVNSPQQPRQPIMSGSLGGGHWTWPGDLTDHLSGTHGQDPAKLAAMTPQQRATLHDQLHTGGAARVFQPQPVLSGFQGGYMLPQYNGFQLAGGGCPNGQCPATRYR